MRISKTGCAAVAILFALSAPSAGSDALFSSKLSRDEQARHALQRLTFGPGPGDLEALEKIGLKKWIELQLHPERLAESPKLAALLSPLDSIRMNAGQIVESYPPPQIVKAIAAGRMEVPDDPERRALLERLTQRYQARFKKSDDMPAAAKRPREDRKELLAQSPVEARRKILLNAAPQQVLAHDLWEAKLSRAIYSGRQLEELLTDFWFNHFNVYLDKGADRFLVTTYERDAIRPHVLGKFREMLQATAESPAMLWYLDNWQSVSANSASRKRGDKVRKRARGLNENYARELLELHTLGVDGGYSQKDIVEIARCFTGWTIRDPYRGARFEFNDRNHDRGQKVVLGVTIPAGGGKEDGLKVLDILAAHPSTARFLSAKLARKFVADQPPDSLINAMAETFRKKDGDLREVMKTLLDSREFWSQGAYRAKVKSPFEMVASAARATNADVTSAFGLAIRVADMGQPLYRKPEPTGYSAANEEWVNSAALLARMNFALALTQNQVPGVTVDASAWEGDAHALARTLLSAEASAQTGDAIRSGLAEKKSQAVLAGLVLGSPEFQRK